MPDNTDDTQRPLSADDALEPRDDIYNPRLDGQHLPEDNDPPAAPADDTKAGAVSEDSPLGDTDRDQHEDYDEGANVAAGTAAVDHQASDGVTPLEPEEKQE